MSQENLDAGRAESTGNAPFVPMSADDLAQMDADRSKSQDALSEAEAGELRKAELASLVLDHWEPNEEDAKCFGVAVHSELVPDEIVTHLQRIESDYELDLVDCLRNGELSVVDVGDFLKAEMELGALEADATAKTAEVAARSRVKSDYFTAITELAESGKKNMEIIAALAVSKDVPESERAKLRGFLRIASIAARFPKDAPIIRARIDAMDMSRGIPSPVAFIQTEIFSSPEHDKGVSEEVQVAIAAEFDLTPRSVVTGSDYEEAMTETRLDADGNEVPVYSEDDPLKFGLGVDGFPSKNGDQQFMRAMPAHGHTITIDVTNMSPDRKGIAASYLGMWKVAEDAGETDFFLDVTQYDLRGQTQVDEFALVRAARLMNYTFGGSTGFDGEIVRGDDAVGMIQWQACLRNPKGDAGRSDRNKSDTRANLRGLGIMDAEGNIDEDVLKAFGEFSRDNWFGAPDYRAVQAHLVTLFPDKLGGRNQA